jgi:hypothetical protein
MSKRKQYDPEPLKRYLLTLLRRTGESYRRASLAAGLPHNAIAKCMIEGSAPADFTCIALASPLWGKPQRLAPTGRARPALPFSSVPVPENRMDPNIRELATLLQQIEDPAIRIQVVEALKVLARAVCAPVMPLSGRGLRPCPPLLSRYPSFSPLFSSGAYAPPMRCPTRDAP